MSKQFIVYMLTNKPFGTLYIGMTNDFARRIFEHQNGLVEGFTKRYGCKMLVYYEIYDNPTEAFHRERAMKKWNRDWKKQLIEKDNPAWQDLSAQIIN
jgi:putative endonuclease